MTRGLATGPTYSSPAGHSEKRHWSWDAAFTFPDHVGAHMHSQPTITNNLFMSSRNPLSAILTVKTRYYPRFSENCRIRLVNGVVVWNDDWPYCQNVPWPIGVCGLQRDVD